MKILLIRYRNEPDNDSDNNANHAGDGGVPHVRHLVDGEVVEIIAVGGGGCAINRINPILGASFDCGDLFFGVSGGTSEILGHGAPEANPHGQNQAHEGATECALETRSVNKLGEQLQMQLRSKR